MTGKRNLFFSVNLIVRSKATVNDAAEKFPGDKYGVFERASVGINNSSDETIIDFIDSPDLYKLVCHSSVIIVRIDFHGDSY